MANDRIEVSDSLDVETTRAVSEDAFHPCPKCGKGGVRATELPCPTCHQAVPTTDLQCPKCGLRYEADSVPVMVYLCRVCGKPGEADRYLETPDRVHARCKPGAN